MQVEIWSDVVCPWCYLGKRHFEQALELSTDQEEHDAILARRVKLLLDTFQGKAAARDCEEGL